MTDDNEAKTEQTEEAPAAAEAAPEEQPAAESTAPKAEAAAEKKPKAKAKSKAKAKPKAKTEAAKETEGAEATEEAEGAKEEKEPVFASPMAYLESQYLKKELPEFRPGDTVRVHQKVLEGGRERVQAFEGVVIKRGGRGVAHSFTVRRVAHAVGVERTFLIHSPRVEKIEVKRRGKVRRARLFYLRGRVGARATRIKEVR